MTKNEKDNVPASVDQAFGNALKSSLTSRQSDKDVTYEEAGGEFASDEPGIDRKRVVSEDPSKSKEVLRAHTSKISPNGTTTVYQARLETTPSGDVKDSLTTISRANFGTGEMYDMQTDSPETARKFIGTIAGHVAARSEVTPENSVTQAAEIAKSDLEQAETGATK